MIRDADSNLSFGRGEILTINHLFMLQMMKLIKQESCKWADQPGMYGKVMMNCSFSLKCKNEKQFTRSKFKSEGNQKKSLNTSGLVYMVACNSSCLVPQFLSVSVSLNFIIWTRTRCTQPAPVPPRASFNIEASLWIPTCLQSHQHHTFPWKAFVFTGC